MKKQSLPAFFISHGGGPCFWMEWGQTNPFAGLKVFLESFHQRLPFSPKAILVISAHWEEQEFTLQTHPEPPMLYDYYGFPAHTYELQYPAPGAPELAKQIERLFSDSGRKISSDPNRGRDHGVFVPLMIAWPKAEIPVIQLSLKCSLNPLEHFEMGKLLAPLREDGILILGSGMSYHNLRQLKDERGVSQAFHSWLRESVEAPPAKRQEKLSAWEDAPFARINHPREEHLIPLMVAAGAAHEEEGKEIWTETVPMWGHQTAAYQFGV